MAKPRNPNLRPPWKPGESGNPAGRAKRPSFEALVAEVLDEKHPGDDPDKRKALARVFVDKMLSDKDGSMIREYLSRTWPAVSKHEVDLPGADAAGLGDRLAALASRRRANGHDRDADDSTEAGPQ